jgi:hypothetical protein
MVPPLTSLDGYPNEDWPAPLARRQDRDRVGGKRSGPDGEFSKYCRDFIRFFICRRQVLVPPLLAKSWPRLAAVSIEAAAILGLSWPILAGDSQVTLGPSGSDTSTGPRLCHLL